MSFGLLDEDVYSQFCEALNQHWLREQKVKILNLDQFLMEEQGVSFGGEEYPLKEITTEEFLSFLEQGDDFESAESTADQMRIGMKMIPIVCPDMPEEVIKQMPLPAMTQLIKKVVEVMAGGNDEEAEDPNPKDAKS